MKRTERMSRVADVADARADQALLQFAEQQRRVAMGEERLAELRRFRDEYADIFNGGSAVGVLQLLNHRHFLQRLNEAITFQSHQLESYRANLHQEHVRVREAHNRAKALDTIVQRLSKQDQRALDRVEQAQADERTQSQYSTLLWTEE